MTTAAGHVHAARLKAAIRASPAQDEIARRLQERTGGRWSCWFGYSTGSYWAIRRTPGRYRLVEGRTPKELIIAMGEADACYGLDRDH